MNAVNYGSGSNEMGGMNQYNGNTMYGGNSFNSNIPAYTGTGATGSPLPSLSSHPIIPIVVSMMNRIITHQEGTFKYFDTNVSTVSICGIISSYKSGAADRRSFIIHDGTGTIRADFYVQDGHDNDVIDGYVRVIGSPREFQGRVTISGYHIDPIFDLNEVTCHYLDCIQCYLHYSKRSTPMSTAATDSASADNMDLESRILKFVRDNKNKTSRATSITEIVDAMKMQGYPEDNVNYAVNVLEQSMHLYQTDPNYYITDSSIVC